MKVDFATAYDCVSWEYLNYLMGRMNFLLRWIRWMDMLFLSIFMSVIINGIPTMDFEVGIELHQGDPLSLFLLLIVA